MSTSLSFRARARSDVGDRKFQGVLRDLASLEEQGKVEGFFNNTENAGKLGGLVEDIRDAMIEYQVCVLNLWISIWSNIRVRLHCSKVSTKDNKASMINNKESTTSNKTFTTSNRISTRSSKISTTRVAQSWWISLRLSSSWTNQWIGIGRPRPPQGIEPHRECRIPLWK